MQTMNACGLKFDTTYTTLPELFYTELSPKTVVDPEIVFLNSELAASLNLDFSGLSDKELARLFSGNQVPSDITPLAQAYAGHQFGHFSILGDGRAHLLGEHVTASGERFDIQFKGSGRTPYSRNGDGNAALGPMLREYIISEAMHHLGVPTTRSLAVVTTGEQVVRETILPGAVLTRVASSHIRAGTFQFAAYQGDITALRALMEYTINRHYPELLNSENMALSLIEAVLQKQVDLIVHWMRVGFIHGVMNTDNMTISGETIDYGPCAFMEAYNPNTVFSSIDYMGRYAYGNQPVITQWNLARLAEALLPLIDDDTNKAIELAGQTIHSFTDLYKKRWLEMMRAKLGMSGTDEGDEQLFTDLLDWMQNSQMDYTNTFRDLMSEGLFNLPSYESRAFRDWHIRWQNRVKKNQEPPELSLGMMAKSNPAIIPRNHKVEEALFAANDWNLEPFRNFVSALSKPYDDSELTKPYKLPPEPSTGIYQTFCGT